MSEEFDSISAESLAAMLPAWLAMNAGRSPSDGTYHQVVLGLVQASTPELLAAEVIDAATTLSRGAIAYPRLAWRVQVRRSALRAIRQVRVQTPDDPAAVFHLDVRHASSQFDFLTASDPVYATSDDGFVYLRNLAAVQETLVSEDGTYTLTHTPLVLDEEVWVASTTRYEPAGSRPGWVDYDSGEISGIESGEVHVIYSSQAAVAALESACIYVDDEPAATPTRLDLWNPHDEAALMVNLLRAPSEDNVSLDDRVRLAYRIARASDGASMRFALGHELGLAGMVSWDGVSTLDLASAGASAVTEAVVMELPRYGSAVREVLTPDLESRTFASAHRAWLPGWRVFLNSSRVTIATHPSLSVSDGIVDFGEEIQGVVTATYRFELYSVAMVDGCQVSPTDNTPPGAYTVLYTSSIDTYPAGGSDAAARLLSSDGRPTALFTAIMEAAKASAPVLVGSTSWGDVSHWFEEDETTPQLTHLPVSLE